MKPWLWIAAFVMFPTVRGAAQETATLLASLASQAKEYQRSVPNFTCNEVVTSTVKHGDKLVKRIEFQADIRVRRKDDQSLEEDFVITSYMGKPAPQGGKFFLPLYMTGGLSSGMPSFFDEASQGCYEYTASGNRVNFVAKKKGVAGCHGSNEVTGFGLLDSQGKLLQGEIRNPPQEAAHFHNPVLGRIDYADVRLSNRVFRMPTHVYGEDLHDGSTRTFEAFYTGCRLFTATLTIVPAGGTSESPAP